MYIMIILEFFSKLKKSHFITRRFALSSLVSPITTNPTCTRWKWNGSGRTIGHWTNDWSVRRHGTVFFNLLGRDCAPRIARGPHMYARLIRADEYMYIYIYGEPARSGKSKLCERKRNAPPRLAANSRWHSLDMFLLIKSRHNGRTTDHGRQYRHII